jgi:hypothetical protein
MSFFSGALMRIIIQIMAAVALLLSTSVPASAKSLDVKANVVNEIGFFYFYTSLEYGCESLGRPIIRVSRKPQNGTLRTEVRKMPMSSKGGCKGRPATGVAVWYTPNKGYRGPDRFSFSMSFPGVAPGASYGGSNHQSYNVNVK